MDTVKKLLQINAELNQINVHGREDIIHMASAMGMLEEVVKCLMNLPKETKKDDSDK